MEITLNEKIQELWTTNKRYILITGGRGSSKSFSVTIYLNDQSYNEHFKALFTRYTMKSAHDSIIPEQKEKIELLGQEKDFHITKEDIINKVTENQIMFRGIKTSSGDQTANLKSLEGVTHFVVDEAEEFKDEETFDTINLSVRTKKAENKVIIILNPCDTNHWIYKRWIKSTHRIINIDGYDVPISTHPDVCHLHLTYLDNSENLSESFLKQMEQMKIEAPAYYGHKAIGQWLDHAEGAIIKNYKQFNLSELKDLQLDKIGYIDVADEGTDYTCYIIAAIQGRKLMIIDVVYSQLNTDVTLPLCVALNAKYKPKYVQCEANSMGAMFGRTLRSQIETSTDLTLISSTQNKHTRIIMEGMFISEYCYFLKQEDRSGEYQNWIDNVLNYDKDPKLNKHDDGIDALAGLSKMARSYFSDVFN